MQIYRIAQMSSPYKTKNGQSISFKVHEDIDKRGGEMKPWNDKRGFTVHTIDAFVNGEHAGYIKTSYIPKEKWDNIFRGNIWRFREYCCGHYDIPEELIESQDENAIKDFYAKNFPWGNPEYMMENQKEKATKQYKMWELWFVDKPIVDFIRVEPKFQRQRVAYALYNYMAKWLGEKFGLKLWMSSTRTESAKAFHQKNLLDYKEYKYKQKMNGGFNQKREYIEPKQAKTNTRQITSDWKDKKVIYEDKIGYIKGYQNEDGRWWINEFVIKPEYRGKGMARELAKHLPYKCRLYAYPLFNATRSNWKGLDTTNLIKFYESIGFKLTDEDNVMIRG